MENSSQFRCRRVSTVCWLSAMCSPNLEYENPEAMRAYDGKGQDVRLAAGQKERVQLQLIATSE